MLLTIAGIIVVVLALQNRARLIRLEEFVMDPNKFAALTAAVTAVTEAAATINKAVGNIPADVDPTPLTDALTAAAASINAAAAALPQNAPPAAPATE